MPPDRSGLQAASTPINQKTFSLSSLPGPSASTSTTPCGRASRRLHVPAEILRASKIAASDPILVASALSARELGKRLSLQDNQKDAKSSPARKPDQKVDAPSPVVLAYAWPSFTLQKSQVAASPSLLLGSILEHGDVVSISPLLPEHLYDISEIRVKLLEEPADRKGKKKATRNITDIEGLVKNALIDLVCVLLGQTFEIPLPSGGTRQAKIIGAKLDDGDSAPKGVYTVVDDVRVTIDNPVRSTREQLIPSEASGSTGLSLGYEAVGGLDRHIAQIRELVELPLTRPDLYRHFGMKPPRGILLHGPPGTGKTLLASSIAASLRLPLISIDGPSLSSPYHGETEQRLRDVFKQAEDCAPSIVVIDEVDALVPAREDAGEVERRVVATLLTLMDGLGDKDNGEVDETDVTNPNEEDNHGRVIVIAATNRPNAIDQALRRPGRFDKEIEIGVPDADARLSILKVLLRRTPHTLPDAMLVDIASKTHGYVGADLSSLIHSAGLNAIRRVTQTTEGSHISTQKGNTADMNIMPDDLDAAFLTTRPSALRSVFLETPQVAWSDIGGQATIKQKLQEVIEWPLKHPETFKRLGVRPPRGILLYGPPGCSKTLIAKALASGAGVNFIAVKGPEIFNKYVGESERTIRETFRKARSAAPCIVFLDEIDVIAGSRDEGEGSGTGDRVLTTLLTEMDGIEELNGVTVLAATNRPEVIDSALMRPGRLDRILYVSPPDTNARKEIFQVNFRRMAINADVDVERLVDMTEGCSGAEVASICQDAAFNAMNEDLDAENVRMNHFEQAASSIRRRITPETIAFYEAWRDSTDAREV